MDTNSIPPGRVVIKERRSLSLWTANLVGFLVLGGILFLFGIAHGWIGTVPIVDALLGVLAQHFWFFGVVVVSIGIHEGIHALAMWKVAGVPWSDIGGGVDWSVLTPYVHTSQVMTAGAYRVVALSPGVLLGFLPAVIGIGTGSILLTLYGALFSGAAGGDLLSVWRLRGVPSEAWIQDAGEGCGCEVVVPTSKRDVSRASRK